MEIKIFLCVYFLHLLRLSGAVTFHNIAGIVTTVNENTDVITNLWSVTATCSPQDANGTYFSVACSTCTISSNPQPGLFEMDGVYTVRKKACSATTCGSCPSCSTCAASSGCTTSGESYPITVQCSSSGYATNDIGTHSFTVNIAAETPTLSITLTSPLSASKSMSQNDVLTTATHSGPTLREWEERTAVANSHILGTARLFALTSSGTVIVNADPSNEYTATYTLQACAHSRRQEACSTTTIDFSGCFQRPTCSDQSNTVADTHAIGGTLFTIPSPTIDAHFSSISSSWQGLSFSEVSSTLTEASYTLDSITGVISTTGNITVHPNYPDMTRTIVVRISNSASCSYTDDCTMTLTVTFTNHPINIINNVTSATIHEDYDAMKTLFIILSLDENDPSQDNSTCTMTNPDSTIFTLEHNGDHDHDAYAIVKKACNDAGCGFLCDLSTEGCLNWNITSSYSFPVTCEDGYGLSDSQTFSLTVLRNEIFLWRNLPMTITVNSDQVSQHDILFQIFYTDAENERLSYNNSVAPAQPSPALFDFDSSGNYFNDPANVTSLTYQWNITNITYIVEICAWERRNYRCEDLTIEVREYCGPEPTCTSSSTVVTDQFSTGGTLFTINVPAPATGSFTSLSYAITTQRPDLFTVDPTTGIITTTAALPIASPPSSTMYSITGLVYDTAACDYASCTFSVTVNFTNMDISIDNMAGVVVDVHEDTKSSVTLHNIATSDANTVDTVSCSVDEANSDPPNNGKFFTMETDVDSNEFVILSIANPGFDYDVQNNYTIQVVCSDQYGSSATAAMTVTISENQQPTMDNLDNTTFIHADPLTTFAGTTLFTLQTSDAENDALTYSCNVSDTWVPLECLSDGVVTLRRNITMPDENGTIYNITICIEEPVHNHTLCEDLEVNFTTSKSYPDLNNLPATVYFVEGTAVGTALFDVTVQDPDVGDTHTFSIVSVSPSEDTSKFSIGPSSGQITLQSELDFETRDSYNITVSVTDQDLATLEDRSLTVNVNDTNEAPTLVLYGNTFNTTEGSTGRTIGVLNFTCTDPDTSESLTFAITTGTYMSYFALNGVSGLLTHALEWDFESGASLPYSTDLIVSCYDDESLTSSATIFVNIATVNEHAPVLNTVSESFTIYSNHTIIDPLLNVTATDADYPSDGNFTFSIAGTGHGADYFTINSDGQLLIAKYIEKTYNFTFEFTIIVSDDDTNPLTSSIDVIVYYIAPNDATIPTKPTKCILCTTQGIIVVAALCTEALLLLSCLFHMCIRMKGYSIFFEQKPKPQLTRVPRRKLTIADIRSRLEDWSDEDEPELAKIPEKDPPPPVQPYSPCFESMDKALPERRPPSAFNYYQKPPSPPPPPFYQQPGIDLSDVPEPVASITGYEGTSIDAPSTGFQGRRRRVRTTADIPPAFKGLNPAPKRNIPQLYRDDDFSPQPIRPHEVSNDASVPLFRVPTRKRPLRNLPNRYPNRLSPIMSPGFESVDIPRSRNNLPRPSYTRHVPSVWDPPPRSLGPDVDVGSSWREGRPSPASRPFRGMDF